LRASELAAPARTGDLVGGETWLRMDLEEGGGGLIEAPLPLPTLVKAKTVLFVDGACIPTADNNDRWYLLGTLRRLTVCDEHV